MDSRRFDVSYCLLFYIRQGSISTPINIIASRVWQVFTLVIGSLKRFVISKCVLGYAFDSASLSSL